MGQLTIYLPDDVEKQVRRKAKLARKSVSAYIASLEKKREPVDANGHPLYLRELFGSMPELAAAMPPRDLTPHDIPDLSHLVDPIPHRHKRLRRPARRR